MRMAAISARTPGWSRTCTASTSSTPESVSDAWREFFADYVPRETTGRRRPPRRPRPRLRPEARRRRRAAPAKPSRGRRRWCSTARRRRCCGRVGAHRREHGGEPRRCRRRRRCARFPAKLLEINRQILNNHLAHRRRQGLVHPHHRVRGAARLHEVPAMNSGYGVTDGQPSVVRHQHVNLGLAIDLTKSDGSRTLLVPNIKAADTLDFAQFHGAYEELLRRVRDGKITADDFAGTTVSITNPGVIGTEHSVPAPDAGPGPHRRRRVDRLPARVRRRRPPDDRPPRREQGRHAHEHLRPPRDPGRGERRVPRRGPPPPRRRRRLLRLAVPELRGALRARALESRPLTDRRDARLGREGAAGAAAHQHVPRARSPDRQPRSARAQGTEDPHRARPDALGPHDLGSRPRVPDRRARGPAHDDAARHPRRAARRVRAHRRRRVHAHPGGRPEGVDPGAGRGHAARGHPGSSARRSSRR